MLGIPGSCKQLNRNMTSPEVMANTLVTLYILHKRTVEVYGEQHTPIPRVSVMMLHVRCVKCLRNL